MPENPPGVAGLQPGPPPQPPLPTATAQGFQPFPATNASRWHTAEPVVAQLQPCDGTEVLARVGDRWILAGEIAPTVNESLEQRGISPAEADNAVRKLLTAMILDQHVDVQLLYQDAKRHMPADRLEEVRQRLSQVFDEDELPKRLKKAGASNALELEQQLRRWGGCLAGEKRFFAERAIGSQWLYQKIDHSEQISLDELWEYYQQHLSEFETPGRAHWEEIRIQIPRYSDGVDAQARLGYVGNLVFQGMPVGQALKAQPPGEPSCTGGDRGWVTQGSLQLSHVLEEAVFQLPVGQLSRILRTDHHLHIVRVLEREEARRVPFEEAQAEIREKIKKQRQAEQIRQTLAELRQSIPVWTVFDDDVEVAQLRNRQATAQ